MVGTTGGLARFDGARFETFLAADYPGLEGDRILALDCDSAGRIWIGPYLGAACIYEEGQFHPVCDAKVLHSVRQFHRSADGATWLVGDRLGRIRDDSLLVFDESHGLSASLVHRIVEDPNGTIWAASDQGVYRLDDAVFERVDERPSHWVMTDFDGFVWSQTHSGDLVPLNGPTVEPMALAEARIRGECEHGESRRLLATSQGIYVLTRKHDGSTGFQIRLSKSAEEMKGLRRSVSCLLSGPGHDLWIGTELDGLKYLESRYVELLPLTEEFPRSPVFHIHPLPGHRALVSGGDFGFAFILDERAERIPVEVLDPDDFHSLGAASTPAGTWLVTRGGLAKLEGLRVVPDRRWRGQAHSIAATQDGSIWLEIEGHLQQVVPPDGSSGDSKSFALPPWGVQAMCAVRGSLIIASRGQLMRLDQSSGHWDLLVDVGHTGIRQLRPGPGGEIWISTYGQGLCRLDSKGRLDQWSRAAGLPDPFLAWIAPLDESGDLWVNSNSGVIRVSIASLDAQAAGQVATIEAQSFRTPECNGVLGAALGSDAMALPTLEGLAIFRRSAVPPPSAAPRVLIRGPHVDGVPVDEKGRYHGRVNLRYEFTAPIYPTSERSSFQYRMVEFHEPWQEAGAAREVRFASLPSRTYTLEVRARTPASHWSLPVRSMTLEVSPYWHERLWTRWMLAGLGLFAIHRVFSRRTRKLRSRNHALTVEMEQRKAAEARLASSESRFRRLFHTAPSAIISWTPSGTLLDRNERADQLFAWGPSDVLDVRPAELFEDPELGRDTMHRAFVSSEDLSVVAMTKVGDFQTKRCRWQFASTRSESGEVTSIIAMISDLSRRDRDARTLTELRESLARAEESERSRIARELHDDLSQRLAALSIEAHLLDRRNDAEDHEFSLSVGSFQSEIDSVATHLHTLSRQLHPTIVDDLGLVAALRSECSRRNNTNSARVTMTVSNDVDTGPRETALGLFRIGQEAIRNAARHSGANVIDVNLEAVDDWLELSISDDGSGFDADESRSLSGIGLKSMRERARLAGGELSLHSNPGGGTCVRARVPRNADALRRALALREG
ncbi:Oxygen sensor histidine kinase NreB [Planctomycetes bacterium Poly30]|uniref:Oxygen sensor histidine kinase NreB n=1 Tax=Saltatorellus ferox TaxID=2528018 RepID=A0A518EUB6_9BACT|nr:Oxygen sensor histidine kinase NreB [Planctomycetes bacterium Poly30]